MKKKQAVLRERIFFLLLVLPTVLWVVVNMAGFSDRLNFDTGENRNLHRMSDNVSLSDLTQELESTYNDHIPFRSILIEGENRLERWLEKPYVTGIEPMLLARVNRQKASEQRQDDSGAEEETVPESELAENRDGSGISSTGSRKDYFPLKISENGVITGREGWLFLEDTLQDYQGLNIPSEEELTLCENLVTGLCNICSEKKIPIYGITFPNKNRIYGEYMPTTTRGDIWRSQVLSECVIKRTALPFRFVYERMLEQKQFHTLYYKQDTHWNTYGALVGVQELYELIGTAPIDESSVYPEKTVKRQDLSALGGDPGEDIADKLIYKPDIKDTVVSRFDDEYYGFFTEGFCEFNSRGDIDQTIVLVGDSYLLELMEFIPQDFRHVIVISREWIEKVDPSLITQADILVTEFVERNSKVWLFDVNSLALVLAGQAEETQQTGVEQQDENIQESTDRKDAGAAP